MNLVQLIALFLGKNVKDVWEASKESLTHTYRVLIMAVAIPVVLLLIGIVFGAIGYHADISACVTVGRTVITFGCFASALLLAFFWLRATVFVHLLVVASKGAHLTWDKIPETDREEAEKLIRWLRGVTLWLTAVCLYAQVVPVWRHIGMSMVAATCMLAFSAIMTARWFDGKYARVVLTLVILGIFVFSTATLIVPGLTSNMQATIDESLGDVDAMSRRRESLSSAGRQHNSEAVKLDAKLLESLMVERNALRQKALTQCPGYRFCNPQDEARHAELEEGISRLRNGSYWNPPAKKKTVQRQAGTVSRLPPPPSVPVKARKKVRKKSKRRKALDEVYAELDNYPDL